MLEDLVGRCDLVLIDAPCTGAGTWRRNPDAKWRVAPGALEQRLVEQKALLAGSARFVKPKGRIVYVTCSLLIDENEAQIAQFCASHPEFAAVSAAEIAQGALLPDLARFASRHGPAIRFSPRVCGTDGFFVAMTRKRAVA